jgi:hypothetical protein
MNFGCHRQEASSQLAEQRRNHHEQGCASVWGGGSGPQGNIARDSSTRKGLESIEKSYISNSVTGSVNDSEYFGVGWNYR